MVRRNQPVSDQPDERPLLGLCDDNDEQAPGPSKRVCSDESTPGPSRDNDESAPGPSKRDKLAKFLSPETGGANVPSPMKNLLGPGTFKNLRLR